MELGAKNPQQWVFKNTLAQTILDLGQAKGYITEDERKGRLSTVQAFSTNPIVKDALGITNTDPLRITTTLSSEDFELVFEKFIKDVASQEITTRKGRDQDGFANYANEIRNIDGLLGKRVDPHEVVVPAKVPKKTKKAKKPSKPTKIVPVDDISDALAAIPNHKLERIYYSLVSLTTKDHTPLLSVGAWAFFETLTAVCGRKSGTDFYSFISKNKLAEYGLQARQKTLQEVVKRFAEFGNSGKHDPTSAAFHGEQLINDFETVKELIVCLASEAKSKP